MASGMGLSKSSFEQERRETSRSQLKNFCIRVDFPGSRLKGRDDVEKLFFRVIIKPLPAFPSMVTGINFLLLDQAWPEFRILMKGVIN